MKIPKKPVWSRTQEGSEASRVGTACPALPLLTGNRTADPGLRA